MQTEVLPREQRVFWRRGGDGGGGDGGGENGNSIGIWNSRFQRKYISLVGFKSFNYIKGFKRKSEVVYP